MATKPNKHTPYTQFMGKSTMVILELPNLSIICTVKKLAVAKKTTRNTSTSKLMARLSQRGMKR